tara:strand:+ start:2518 stop:2799 length:282 start_codon:yes stop_codon:yes gene_type:complete
MNKELELLEEKGYQVVWSATTAIPTKAGMLNKDILAKAKADFLKETISIWKDDLVFTSQGYPANGFSDVIFDIDVVILKRDDYERLTELIKNE